MRILSGVLTWQHHDTLRLSKATPEGDPHVRSRAQVDI